MTTGFQRGGSGDALVEYKRVLEEVLNNRPSGTRMRLATALGKNRSFISQISNPLYPTPIPAIHLTLLFEVCRCSNDERRRFLSAYAAAHPGRRIPGLEVHPVRQISLEVPDFGDEIRNRALDSMLVDYVRKLCRLVELIPTSSEKEGSS